MTAGEGAAALDAYDRAGDPADLQSADRLLRGVDHPDRTELHEGLRVHRLPPADALHRAQRWMRDPRRDLAGIPPDLLAGHHPGAEFPLAAWAGFVHLGR